MGVLTKRQHPVTFSMKGELKEMREYLPLVYFGPPTVYRKALCCKSAWWSLLGAAVLTWTFLSVVSKFSLLCYSKAPAGLIKGKKEIQTFYWISSELRPYGEMRRERAASKIEHKNGR